VNYAIACNLGYGPFERKPCGNGFEAKIGHGSKALPAFVLSKLSGKLYRQHWYFALG
jgi:hypothetical protein